MATIIGLGNGACNIAQAFLTYPQYEIYLLDTEYIPHKNFKLVDKREDHMGYESSFPDLTGFLYNSKGPYTVIICGGGAISGGCLRLLEQLRGKKEKINILYIKPEDDLLSDIRQKQDKITFQVLQQYTRSGLIDNMFIISNSECENHLSNLTIKNFYSSINVLIASTYHMYNVFNNIEPIMQTASDPIDVARIATLGFMESGEERMLYNLQLPREKNYYYSICKDNLESNVGLMSTIKEEMRSKLDEHVKVSYSSFENDYDQDYIYTAHFTSVVQEENYNFSLDDLK